MSEALEHRSFLDPVTLLGRADRLKAARQVFDSHWQEVADYILPSREFTRMNQPGAKRLTRIFNSAAGDAAKQLAGGLHGMLTSPALRWFALRAETQRGQAEQFDHPTTAWFESATDAMYQVFDSPKAGFSTAAHECYLDLTFGTACMFVGDGGAMGPTFQAVPLKEVYVACRGGRVDTVFRVYQEPARAIEALFPEAPLPKMLEEACEKDPDRMFELVHAVIPVEADERSPFAFHSIYLLREGQVVLERGGFHEMPYCIPRWSKRSGEDYGDGPGMDALPDTKLLNKLEELNLRGLAKVVDPPLMAPNDGFLAPVTTQPGGINYYRAGEVQEGDRITPLITGARPDLGLEYIQALEGRIQRTFFVTWMNLPTRSNMTATEVLQRRDEQLRLLGPMVSRLQMEFLGPLIERVFKIMWRNRLFEAPPEELAGARWEVEYLSPLALSQKASDADAMMRWAGALGQMARFDPSALDILDTHAAGRFLGDRYGVSQSVMRSEADAQALNQQRQQQQAQMAQISGAQGIARAAKDGAGAMGALAGMQPQGTA